MGKTKYIFGAALFAAIIWITMSGLRDFNINGNVTNMNETLISFSTIMKGNDIKILNNKTAIIKNKEEWSQLWKEIYPTQAIAPSIDFSKITLIGTFGGNKPSGGYEYYISKIRSYNDRVEVIVEEVSPNERCFVSKAETQPYHIIILDKNDKPVNFIFEERVISC